MIASIDWGAVSLIATPAVAGLALWANARGKKTDNLARRIEITLAGQDRLIENLQGEVTRQIGLTAVCEAARLLDRETFTKSLNVAHDRIRQLEQHSS